MGERALAIGASVAGALALGGLYLLSQRHNPLAPRVGGVRIVPAVGTSPAYVEIGVEPSPALLRMGKEGDSWEYRVADASGRIYAMTPNSDEHTRRLRIPYAYGRPARDPRIEVWVDGERRAATSVEGMPPPVVVPLDVESGAPIRAFRLSAAEEAAIPKSPDLLGGIRLAPRRPTLPKERWIIKVVRTSLQPRTDAKTEFAAYAPRIAGSPPNPTLGLAIAPLPFAEDVASLRVRVRRVLHRTRSERILVSGLRLVDRGGQTELVSSASRLPNSLGLDLRVDPKFVPYHGRFVGGDERAPSLPFALLASNDARTKSEEDPWADDETLMEIEGPDLTRLNVRSLHFGNAWWLAKRPASGPVYRKPFSVVLTVTKQWDEALGTFEATIPVEPAQTS